MKIIEDYVVLLYAQKLFKDDYKAFETFSNRNVYLDKMDSVLESVQNDLNQIKWLIHNKYHLKVTKNDSLNYDWKSRTNQGKISFTSNQLRELTKELMSRYLYGDLAKPYKRKDRSWFAD